MTEGQWFVSWAKTTDFLFLQMAQAGTGAQPPVHLIQGNLPTCVKRSGCKADHLPPFNGKGKGKVTQ
jgi:hypothetical protein